jgi:hypothetical protein
LGGGFKAFPLVFGENSYFFSVFGSLFYEHIYFFQIIYSR